MAIFPASPKRLTLSPTPYAEVTAAPGASQATGIVVSAGTTVVTTCATDGNSLRLPSTSDVATLKAGDNYPIWNRTTKAAALFPPVGKKIYLNGADQGANNSILLEPGSRAMWMIDNSGNYMVG